MQNVITLPCEQYGSICRTACVAPPIFNLGYSGQRIFSFTLYFSLRLINTVFSHSCSNTRALKFILFYVNITALFHRDLRNHKCHDFVTKYNKYLNNHMVEKCFKVFQVCITIFYISIHILYASGSAQIKCLKMKTTVP